MQDLTRNQHVLKFCQMMSTDGQAGTHIRSGPMAKVTLPHRVGHNKIGSACIGFRFLLF